MRLHRTLWMAAGLAACCAAPSPALAAIGDVVALVDAHAVVPAPTAAPASGAASSADTGRGLAVADPALAQALAAHGLDRAASLGPAFAAGGDVVLDARLAPGEGAQRLVLLSASAGPLDAGHARAAARDLVARGLARAAMPDRALKLFDTTPNDTDYVYQWYLADTGGGVHAAQGWDVYTGSSSVVIGILDTGVDLGHPDLAAKIWTNPGEIPGNGIDDDGDGYVDDVHGYDFGDHDNDPNPTPLFDSQGLDEGFHGTAVAGTAAAATNNLFGVSGVDWQARIMALKFSDSASQTLASYAGEAMLYAAAHHVGVLNMSFGASAADSETMAFFQDLVNQENAAGVVCVAAAGNEGSSAPSAPAGCTGTLSVGSTSATSTRSSFSNWGPWVNICAPGENIWAPISRNYVLDSTSEFVYEFFFGYDGGRPYMFSSGTSLSTPIVSGACALVRGLYPAAAPFGVMQHMIQTADAIAFDEPIGPRLNVYQALAITLDAGRPGELAGAPGLALAPARPTPFVGTTRLSFTLARGADVRLSIVNVAGRPVRTLVRGALAAGPYSYVWDGTDDAGRRAPSGLYFAVLTGGGQQASTRLVRID